MGVAMRDTDRDWRSIGSTQPYWGVLTQPRFRQENLDPPAVEEFYALGRHQVAAMAADLERLTGAPLHVRSALEFGCGAGRLSEALVDYADEVVGYDVSPGMLEVARGRSGRVHYTDLLPERSFDWINAYTVFQHIPPERGVEELRRLLDRLAPAGLISLHFTLRREAALQPARPIWWRNVWRARAAVGAIEMYDYDPGALLEMFDAAGIGRTMMVSTNHGGHHGAFFFGQRGPPAFPY